MLEPVTPPRTAYYLDRLVTCGYHHANPQFWDDKKPPVSTAGNIDTGVKPSAKGPVAPGLLPFNEGLRLPAAPAGRRSAASIPPHCHPVNDRDSLSWRPRPPPRASMRRPNGAAAASVYSREYSPRREPLVRSRGPFPAGAEAGSEPALGPKAEAAASLLTPRASLHMITAVLPTRDDETPPVFTTGQYE
jgi:hypothetical protein